MITLIKLSTEFSYAKGNVKIAKLKDATKNNFHNLDFMWCPSNGSFDIMVQSDYEFTYESGRPMTEADAENELRELTVEILMDLI